MFDMVSWFDFSAKMVIYSYFLYKKRRKKTEFKNEYFYAQHFPFSEGMKEAYDFNKQIMQF